jgi:hypothetical protein
VFAALSQRLSQRFFAISNFSLSDAPGTLTITGVVPITKVIRQGRLTTINMAHGSFAQLLYILTGVAHVLMIELADHLAGLFS